MLRCVFAAVLGWIAWGPFAVARSTAGAVLVAAVWLLVSLPRLNADSAWRIRRAALAGAAAAPLWAIDSTDWALACVLVVAHCWLGAARWREVVAWSVAVIVPTLLLVVSIVTGSHDAMRLIVAGLGDGFRPPGAFAARALAVLGALAIVRTAKGASDSAPTETRERVLVGVLLAGIAFVLVERSGDVLSEAALSTDLRGWAEPSFLSNILKLRAGLPVYGDPADVDSFVYSPLLEVVQRALLSPFHRDLDIAAHRRLVLGCEVAASAIVAAGVWGRFHELPRGKPALLAAPLGVATLCLLSSSYASPHVHPDHPLHACVALATALLLLRRRLPRPVFTTGVVLVPVFAVAFKLTGAGVLLGLCLALCASDGARRWWRPFAVSALLCAATVPLYQALFGRFIDYAIVLLKLHAVHPERALAAARSWYVAFLALGVLSWSRAEGEARSEARSLLLLSFGVFAFSLAAFCKEGGSSNNLVAPVLPALTACVLAGASGSIGASTAFAALVAALTGLGGNGYSMDHAHVEEDHRVAVSFLRDELRHDGHPLSHSIAAWVAAGASGIPVDQLRPAVELYLASAPEFTAFLSHIESGRYTSIITPGAAFIPSPEWYAAFARRYQAAISERYCVVYPADANGNAVLPSFGGRTLILRRKDLGCGMLRLTPSSESGW